MMMTRDAAARLAATAALYLTMMAFHEYAHAEENASQPSPAASEAPASSAPDAERIEVTGSHIKRIDVEGVSPVQTVTKKDIEKKGYDNLGDVVRDLGVNTFGSGTASGNSSAPGNADINLRGLGSDNTLVLLNGVRLPQDAITGTVDINLIPLAAVDRVEILKDGASAIYGSDALGGVVNIITRRDFQGTEVSATEGLPTNYGDGKRTKASLVNGLNFEKLNIVTSIDYRYDQPIYSRNRDWSDNGYSLLGNPPAYANNVNGTDGPFHTPANCPAASVVTTPAGSFCRFKYSDYSEEMPQVMQIGGLSEAHYEVNSDVKLYSRIGYSHRDVQTEAAPSPGLFTIPASSVGHFNPPGWDGTDPLDLNLRLTPLGPRNTDVTSNAYSGVVGTTVQLPNDWTLDVSTSANWVKSLSSGTSGFALVSTVQNLINSGGFNPFANPGSQGDLSSAAYVPTENTKSVLTTFEAKASGDLGQDWAGPVGLAVGTLVSYSDYSDVTDSQTLNNNVFGNAGSAGGGHRTSEAVYSELSLPLITKKLEMQLAGRFDNYSDFGNTVNPKVGLLYHASPSLLFRGSVGTGFRAPLLSELYAAQSIGYPAFIDHVACAAHPGSIYCQAQQYQVTSGGNPDLKQETSLSYTLGGIYEPLPAFNIGTDFFYTKISNMPGIDYNDMTQAELNGVNPAQYGVTVNRDSAGIIQSVVAPLQNLSATNEMGVDISASYTYGRLKLMTEQNQLFYYHTEGFPGAGLVNKLGWNGMPAFRNATSITALINERSDATATVRTIPGQKTLDQTGELTPLATLDLTYTYRTRSIGEFSLAVINVLNSQPPYDASNPTGMVNYSLYDPNGRQVVLGYRVRI